MLRVKVVPNAEQQLRKAYRLGMQAQSKRVIGPTLGDLEKFVTALIELKPEYFKKFAEHIASMRV